MSRDPVDYDAFLPDVLPFVHGCGDLVAVHAVRSAAIEFCERSDWWLYEVEPMFGMINVQDYDIDELPVDSSVVRVVEAAYGGVPLKFLTMDELRAKFGVTWRSLPPGTPRYAIQLTQDQISLVPKPGIGSVAEVTAFVSLRPTRDSGTCDYSIYERWSETVAQGALARLCSTAGQPFSNPPAAAAYRVKFNVGCNEAKRERMRGLSTAGDRVQMPRFV